jgi:hypothetical protein
LQPVAELTVIAVDWSGARGHGRHAGIWVTAMRGDTVVIDRGSWSRAETVAFVLSAPPPIVAGFDFSFGVPEWFARTLGCTTVDEVWARAERCGEQWLAPTVPFWRDRCELPREQRFRACEVALRGVGYAPKSVFQLVGNGQVGAGSVRGMPHLARLRAAGFAIWPFDGARDRIALEIYPSLLRKRFPQLVGVDDPSKDARDARVSARAMTARADEFASLTEATDPIERLEGNVWVPVTSPSALR